jgi:hypothetical protein
MASTLDDALFVLVDTTPGPVTDGPNPSDWTLYTNTEDFPVGTKRAVYSDTHSAWCTMLFAKIFGRTGFATGAVVKQILGLDDTAAAAGTTGWAYSFTPDGGDAMLQGSIALLLGTIAFGAAGTTWYGWVQVGGPPNVDLVSGLDGNYVTDGNVIAETGMQIVDGTTCQLGIAATTVGLVSAFSGAADA